MQIIALKLDMVKGGEKRGHIVADTLLLMMFLGWANERDTKHFLRTQNVSDKNQKHFMCLGHKFCVRNNCCAHGQTGKHLCPQQCVRNILSLFATTLTLAKAKIVDLELTFFHFVHFQVCIL